MSNKTITNTAASVKARLMNAARARHATFNTLLSRYANERFLYRLSISSYRDSFILKGGNLFLIWQDGYPYRPTIDSDFLVIGQADPEYLKGVFGSLCTLEPQEPDGLTFDPASVTAAEIREEAQYGGTRINLNGSLGGAMVYLQFDIGVGDVVTPAPKMAEYPALLDFDHPVLRTYPQETAIAEKVKTMISLGMANSRMKDYADVLILLRNFNYEYDLLKRAVGRTFARYEVPLPSTIPMCFTDAFFNSLEKQKMWTAFRKKSGAMDLPEYLPVVVEECAGFVLPLFFQPVPIPKYWIAGHGWGQTSK